MSLILFMGGSLIFSSGKIHKVSIAEYLWTNTIVQVILFPVLHTRQVIKYVPYETL